MLNDIAVRRCLFSGSVWKPDNVQLHNFCDASCLGFAVVSYIVVTDS